MSFRELWLDVLNVPENYSYTPFLQLKKRYSFEECDAELYIQANGPGTVQRVLKAFPKAVHGKLPAVAVPFYFPERMMGFDLETGEILERYAPIAMMSHLAKRGFMTISADAYHLTYLSLDLERENCTRWKLVGNALHHDYPRWCGMGKLLADTRLLLDALEEDERVDKDRIGIAGHSLGGKMAFYAGCLDPRVKAVLVSDFGFVWEKSNWQDVWYYGERLAEMKQAGMDHSQILDLAGGKPFLLLAGEDDDEESYASMRKASSYWKNPENLHFLHHASGHRPPPAVLEKGYDFLEQTLREKQ